MNVTNVAGQWCKEGVNILLDSFSDKAKIENNRIGELFRANNVIIRLCNPSSLRRHSNTDRNNPVENHSVHRVATHGVGSNAICWMNVKLMPVSTFSHILNARQRKWPSKFIRVVGGCTDEGAHAFEMPEHRVWKLKVDTNFKWFRLH